jgi:hypothetical protein
MNKLILGSVVFMAMFGVPSLYGQGPDEELSNTVITSLENTILSGVERSGVVTGFKKQSLWSENRHWVELDAILTLNRDSITAKVHKFTIEMNAEELVGFHLVDGSIFQIAEETPDAQFLQSIFILDFNSDKLLYEAKGSSVSLTRKDFEPFTVTRVYIHNPNEPRVVIYLNHYPNIPFVVYTTNQGMNKEDFQEGLLLTIELEDVIASSPGQSNFTFRSVNDGKVFKAQGDNLETFWKPTQEQIDSARVVMNLAEERVWHGLVYKAILNDGRAYGMILVKVNSAKHWDGKISDRLIEVAPEVFVNLRTCAVLYSYTYHDINGSNDYKYLEPQRHITKTW